MNYYPQKEVWSSIKRSENDIIQKKLETIEWEEDDEKYLKMLLRIFP